MSHRNITFLDALKCEIEGIEQRRALLILEIQFRYCISKLKKRKGTFMNYFTETTLEVYTLTFSTCTLWAAARCLNSGASGVSKTSKCDLQALQR